MRTACPTRRRRPRPCSTREAHWRPPWRGGTCKVLRRVVPTFEHRLRNVASAWRDILAKLQEHVRAKLEIPAKPRSLAALKRYEDALDALVCAWVGIEFLAGRARAMGDAEAVIWSGVVGQVIESAFCSLPLDFRFDG